MSTANSGSFSSPDFTQAGNKPCEKFCIFKINLSDISLAEVTIHN